MQGFELRAMQWFKHGDSDRVEQIDPQGLVFCPACHHTMDKHGRFKPTGEILCPGSWIPKDFDDVVDTDV
jgi:hypothetical protein